MNLQKCLSSYGQGSWITIPAFSSLLKGGLYTLPHPGDEERNRTSVITHDHSATYRQWNRKTLYNSRRLNSNAAPSDPPVEWTLLIYWYTLGIYQSEYQLIQSPCQFGVLNLSGGRRQPPRSTPYEKDGDVFFVVSPAPQSRRHYCALCNAPSPAIFYKHLLGGAWDSWHRALRPHDVWRTALHPEQG